MEDSDHFLAMLRERAILRTWVDLAIRKPDLTNEPGDGTKHFMKKISENENRWLRVIVNVKGVPNRFITAFFDRRLRREK